MTLLNREQRRSQGKRGNLRALPAGVPDLAAKAKEKTYSCPKGHSYQSETGWRMPVMTAPGRFILAPGVGCPECVGQFLMMTCPAFEVDAMGNLMGYQPPEETESIDFDLGELAEMLEWFKAQKG